MFDALADDEAVLLPLALDVAEAVSEGVADTVLCALCVGVVLLVDVRLLLALCVPVGLDEDVPVRLALGVDDGVAVELRVRVIVDAGVCVALGGRV